MGSAEIQMGDCGCCHQYRHLEELEIPVGDILLLGTGTTPVKNGHCRLVGVCGECRDLIRQGWMVTPEGRFISPNGVHFTDYNKSRQPIFRL